MDSGVHNSVKGSITPNPHLGGIVHAATSKCQAGREAYADRARTKRELLLVTWRSAGFPAPGSRMPWRHVQISGPLRAQPLVELAGKDEEPVGSGASRLGEETQ